MEPETVEWLPPELSLPSETPRARAAAVAKAETAADVEIETRLRRLYHSPPPKNLFNLILFLPLPPNDSGRELQSYMKSLDAALEDILPQDDRSDGISRVHWANDCHVWPLSSLNGSIKPTAPTATELTVMVNACVDQAVKVVRGPSPTRKAT